MNPGSIIHTRQIQVTSEEINSTGDRQCKRGAAELDWRKTQQDVMHDRIRHKHQIDNGRWFYVCELRNLFDQFTQCLTNNPGQFSSLIGMHHDVGHATHQIFAEPNLRIHQTRAGNDFTTGQITEIRGNGRRTNIKRYAIESVPESCPNSDQFPAIPKRNGNEPVLLPQDMLQCLQNDRIIAIDFQIPLCLQCLQQTIQVPFRVIHIGLGYLNSV